VNLRRSTAGFLALYGLAFSAAHAGTACAEHYAGGVPPRATLTSLQPLYPLCLPVGALMYSGARNTSIWAAEHITSASLAEARRVPRADAFHEESALPNEIRTRPDEYKHSCFDRGHLIPSGDARDSAAQFSSFSMANMTPQAPANNEGIWEAIETATRKFAQSRGSLYVVTGPMYLAPKAELLAGRIAVPTHYYKAVLDAATGEGAAYISANSTVQSYDIVPLPFLTKISGIDPFPAMGPSIRMLNLPRPHEGHFRPREVGAACARNPDGTLVSGGTESPQVVDQAAALRGALGAVTRRVLRAVH
jgi:endonuclease G